MHTPVPAEAAKRPEGQIRQSSALSCILEVVESLIYLATTQFVQEVEPSASVYLPGSLKEEEIKIIREVENKWDRDGMFN